MELRRYLHLLRRRWLVLVICVVVGAGVGFAITPRTHTYQTSAEIYVGYQSYEQDPGLLNVAEGLNELIATYSQMIPSPAFAAKAIASTGVHRSVGQVVGETSTSVVPDTTLIQVTVSDPNPTVAEKLADGIADAFVAQVSNHKPGATVGPGSVPAEPAYVFQTAPYPAVPAPNGLARHVGLGALFGLVVAVLAVLLLDYLDITVKSPEDLERRLGLAVLGVVPARRQPLVAPRRREPKLRPVTNEERGDRVV